MDSWLGGAIQSSETNAICLLFSDKPAVPPLFRSIAIEFEGKLGFGMATSNDKQLMANFNVKKAPTLLILFPDTSKPTEDGRSQMTGMQFTPQAREILHRRVPTIWDMRKKNAEGFYNCTSR